MRKAPIFLLLAIITTGCMQSTPGTEIVPTVSERENETTVAYQSKMFPVQLRYPAAWKASKQSDTELQFFLSHEGRQEAQIEMHFDQDRRAFGNAIVSDEMLLKGFTEKFLQDIPASFQSFTVLGQDTMKIGEQNAFGIDFLATKENRPIHIKQVWTYKDGRGYVFFIIGEPDTFPIYAQEFDRIVQSVSFNKK